MRIARIAAAALTLLFALAARGEAVEADIDLSEAQAVVNDAAADVDLAELMRLTASGAYAPDADEILTRLKAEIRRALSEAMPSIAAASAPLILWSLVRNLLPGMGEGRERAAGYACVAACALTLMRLFEGAYQSVAASVERLSRLTDAVVPALTAMLTVTGGTRASALITPMGALASRLTALAVQKCALPLCAAGACVAVADGMGGLKLKRLGGFAKTAVKWALTSSVSVYLALMATGGLVGGVYDGAALKGAKYAADNLLPVIGGKVAGMMDSITASLALLRNGVGLAGYAALFAVCLPPLIRCVVTSLLCRLLAAVSEPVGGERLSSLMDAFADALGLLVAVTASSAAYLVILIGAALGMGSRIAG